LGGGPRQPRALRDRRPDHA